MTQPKYKDLNLLPLPLEVATNFAKLIDSSFYIQKKNGEFVEISQKTSLIEKTFQSYKEHGVKEIFFSEENFNKLKQKLDNVISQKAHYSEAFKEISHMYSTAKNQLELLGFKKMTLKQCEDVNIQIMKQLRQVPGLLELLLSFKEKGCESFYRYVLLSFVGNSMIQTFNWQSDQIKSKMGMACLFCDISLTSEDHYFMANNDREKWSSSQLYHPTDTAQKLKEAYCDIPHEVLQLVEQHHEGPHSDGYPKGSPSNQIPLISSIIIVAGVMVEKILSPDFTPDDRDFTLECISKDYNKGVFRTATDSLYRAVGLKI